MIKNKLQIIQIDQKLQKLKIERSELMGLNLVKSTGLRFLIFLLLICGQAWGSADTLQPREDGSVLWNHTGCDAGERHDCLDDPPGSPDGDTTCAYTSTPGLSEEFKHDSTFVSNIDSVVIRINAKKTDTETVKLQVGWAYLVESLWYFWIEDSVTLTTSWADYWVNADDEENWTYQKINARRFGVLSANYTKPDSFGKTSANTDFNLTTNYISAYRYQADFSGIIDTLAIRFYDPTPTGNCKLAIYSDSGASPGYPYLRKDTTTEFTITDGWNRVPLVTGNVPVVNNSYYWIFLRVGMTGSTTKRDAGPYANCGRYKTFLYSEAWPVTAPTGMNGEQIHYVLQAIGGCNLESRITQSFVIVYYTEEAEEAKKQGGIVQDEDSRGLVEGGIAR